FPYAGNEPDAHLGDILISVDTAAANARRYRLTPARELRNLIIHGIVHLLGYDHTTDQGQMRRLERRVRPAPLKPEGALLAGWECLLIMSCLMLLPFLSSVESAIRQVGVVTLKVLAEKREGKDPLLNLLYDDRQQVMIALHVGTQTCTLTLTIFVTLIALRL